jgi:LEA14-like dessication related protein
MRSARLAVPVALAALVAACGGTQRVTTPTIATPPLVYVDALVPGAIDAFGANFSLQGRIENPNPVQLALAGVDYAFDVEGSRVSAGRAPSRATLPAGATAPFAVPVRLEWAQVPAFAQRLLTQQSLGFALSGAAQVQVGRGELALPYATQGQVALPRLPAVALEGVALRDAGPFHTTLELRVGVRNPNAFALPLGRFAYDVSLSGVSVAHAASSRLEAVAANASTTVLVPVRFSTVGAAFGAAAGAVSSAVRGSADVALTGRAGYGVLEVDVDARRALVR